MLELAMQMYTGPKAIVAEQEMTPFFHVDQGVPAGCPQAPLLAKAILIPALAPWHAQHQHIHLSSWVDDIGYDTASSTPQGVAHQAVEAYRDLHRRLTELGMKVSAKKTAFIGTDKHVNRALKELLTENEPPVVPVMRDLGIDHQAGRARRIPVMKQRMQKAKQRRLKLRNLKIPTLRVRLRLHCGGIQPVAIWGVESQGLAPRYPQALRQALAKQLGHHNGGILDVTYMTSTRPNMLIPEIKSSSTTSEPCTCSYKAGLQSNYHSYNKHGKRPIKACRSNSTHGTPSKDPWPQQLRT